MRSIARLLPWLLVATLGAPVEERVTTRLMQQRLRIEALSPTDDAHCRTLGLDAIELRHRGRRVDAERLIELER